mgnify:CR=1 FL=1
MNINLFNSTMSEIHFYALTEDERGIQFYKTISETLAAIEEDDEVRGESCFVILGHCDEDYWVSDEANGEDIHYREHEHRKGRVLCLYTYLDTLIAKSGHLNNGD